MEESIPNPVKVFKKFIPNRDQLLIDLEKKAAKNDIPIVGPFVGHFLAILVKLSGAKNILELGTATGYSSIWMGRALKGKKGKLISIEQYEKTARLAEQNIAKAELSDIVTIKAGIAKDIIPQLEMQFDMIFMDVDKEYYGSLLPLCAEKIKRKGLLVADNTAFKEAQSFNKLIYNSDLWDSVNIFGLWPQHNPDMDGICLALKN